MSLAWQIEFTDRALKNLRKMDRPVAKRIVGYLRGRVAEGDDPRAQGKCLKGQLRAYWRYRVADYRVICDLQDSVMRVLVVDVAHRKAIYKDR